MSLERKFLPLVALSPDAAKSIGTTDGPGSFRGYPSKFYDLDDVADIVLPGAYKDTIEEFLQAGFTAHSHDWGYDGVIGYPVSAVEDEIGLDSVTEFHSTPDAQMVRTKAAERLKAGKKVFLSIGYEVLEAITIRAADYAKELPKYIPAAKLAATLAKARNFTQVRLLKKIHLYEYSLVTAPALRTAEVSEVKSHDVHSTEGDTPRNRPPEHTPDNMKPETKAQYLGEYVEESATLAALSRLNDALFYSCVYECISPYGMQAEKPLAERLEQLRAAFDEYRDLSLHIIEQLMGGDEETREESAALVKTLWHDPAGSGNSSSVELRANSTLQARLETALAAVERVAGDVKAVHALRAKAGRTISAARRQTLADCHQAMKSVVGEIDALLIETDPQKDEKAAALVKRQRQINLLQYEAEL
jgi:HK97 family phage prohead protease